MGIFDSVTTEEKRTIMEVQLSQLKLSLWSHLIAIQIDPDTFDENSWEGPEEWMGPNHPARFVLNHVQQIQLLEQKIASLD